MDLSRLYGPGYAGYLHGRQQVDQRNMQGMQGLGMLSDMQTQGLQREGMQAQMLERQRKAQIEQNQLQQIQGLLNRPDEELAQAIGMPAAQARSLFAMGGPGALTKVMEHNAQLTPEQRLIVVAATLARAGLAGEGGHWSAVQDYGRRRL